MNVPPIHRTGPDAFALDIDDEERHVIGSVIDQMRELLLSDEDNSLQRLYPPAYTDDDRREDEYQSLVHDDLLARRLDALDEVEKTLTHAELDTSQVNQWMGAINDARLVLGTQLDVSEDMEMVPLDHPDAHRHLVYDYLGHLLAHIVDAMSADL